MKTPFEAPEIALTEFRVEDVVTASISTDDGSFGPIFG